VPAFDKGRASVRRPVRAQPETAPARLADSKVADTLASIAQGSVDAIEMKIQVRYAAAAAILVSLFAYVAVRNIWYSDAFSGKVLDANDKPIKGAVVLAAWRSREFLTGSFYTSVVREATTEQDGSFRIEGWGPRFATRLFSTLDGEQPTMWVVASGSYPLVQVGGRNFALGSITLNASPSTSHMTLQLTPLPVHPDPTTRHSIEYQALLAHALENGIEWCVWEQARAFESKFSEIEASVGSQDQWFPSRKCPRL